MELSTEFKKLINSNPHVRFISELNKSIEANGLTMVYEGQIDQEIIKTISNSIEKKMNQDSLSFKLNRLIFHISIEMLQNISKYSEDEIKGKGIIIVGKAPNGYYISSGNVIKNSKIIFLKTILENLNNLSKEELDELYQNQISGGGYNQKGGAGLGLIDIIRKSGNALLFNFEKLNHETSFFLITAVIIK